MGVAPVERLVSRGGAAGVDGYALGQQPPVVWVTVHVLGAHRQQKWLVALV